MNVNKNRIILIGSLMLLFGALFYGLTHLDHNKARVNQTEQNQTDLNLSKYYDNDSKVCQSPEINQTNESQLRACVSNQTTG